MSQKRSPSPWGRLILGIVLGIAFGAIALVVAMTVLLVRFALGRRR